MVFHDFPAILRELAQRHWNDVGGSTSATSWLRLLSLL